MKIDSTIINEFRDESKQLLKELTQVVENLEIHAGTSFPDNLLTDFAQKIDRIMGSAKTLSMDDPDHPGYIAIGNIAESCKSMGYRAAEKKKTNLLPFFAAFWADAIEVLENLLNNLEDVKKTEDIVTSFPLVLQNRLTWLKAKIDKA